MDFERIMRDITIHIEHDLNAVRQIDENMKLLGVDSKESKDVLKGHKLCLLRFKEYIEDYKEKYDPITVNNVRS